jgi:hypothetical protein
MLAVLTFSVSAGSTYLCWQCWQYSPLMTVLAVLTCSDSAGSTHLFWQCWQYSHVLRVLAVLTCSDSAGSTHLFEQNRQYSPFRTVQAVLTCSNSTGSDLLLSGQAHLLLCLFKHWQSITCTFCSVNSENKRNRQMYTVYVKPFHLHFRRMFHTCMKVDFILDYMTHNSRVVERLSSTALVKLYICASILQRKDIVCLVSTNEVTEIRTNDWTQTKYPIPLPISTESGIPPGFRISHENYVLFLYWWNSSLEVYYCALL